MLMTGLLVVLLVYRLDRRHRLSFQELCKLKEESETETSRRQSATDSLFESENRQRALLEAISDTVAVLDQKGNINYYRAEADTEAYGAPLNIGKNISEVLPWDVVDLMLNSLQQALQTGEVQKDEFQLQTDSDTSEVRYFHSRMSQIGGQEQVLLLIRDVSMHISQFREDTLVEV
jgi:PAS domain S-box-containing protein